MQNIRHRNAFVTAILMGLFFVTGPVAHSEPALDTSSFENFESSITALTESLESNPDLSIAEKGDAAVRIQFIATQLAMSVGTNPNKSIRELRAEALKRFRHLNGLTAKQLATAPMEAPLDAKDTKTTQEVVKRWLMGEPTELGLGPLTFVHNFGKGEYADRVLIYIENEESGDRTTPIIIGVLKEDLSGYKSYSIPWRSIAAAETPGHPARGGHEYEIDSLDIITEPINTAKMWFQKIAEATHKPTFMAREVPVTGKARIEGGQNPPLMWAVYPAQGLHIYHSRDLESHELMAAGSDNKARDIIASNPELFSSDQTNMTPEDKSRLQALEREANTRFVNLGLMKLTSDLPAVFEIALNDAKSRRKQKADAANQQLVARSSNEQTLDSILGPSATAKPKPATNTNQPTAVSQRSVTYRARISSLDLRNSKGLYLPDLPDIQARDILLQDRFNYHQKGLRDAEDTNEGLYEEGKDTMRKFFEGKTARLADGGDPMPLLSSEPVVDVTLTESEIVVTPAE